MHEENQDRNLRDKALGRKIGAHAAMPESGMTLPFPLADRLKSTLAGRGWVTRSVLAAELHVSVREIRDAASQAGGAVLSGNAGIKLTSEATQDEVDECCGRFSSQVSAMTRRIVETRTAWERRA